MFFVLVLLEALGACALLTTGVSYSLAWRAYGRHTPPRFLRCQHPIAARLSGIATSLASQATVLLTYPLGPIVGRRPKRASSAQQPAVICLHGLYHNASAFVVLRPVLERRGLGPVVCLSYGSLHGDFETVAQELLAQLRREVPPQTPLLLLGHSLGGLLARRLAAEPDVGPRVRALVTLGAPHHGSTLATLAVGRLGRSLLPSSPLGARVEALPDPPEAALLSLASPVDNMVIPLAGLCVGRATWHEEATVPISHVAMLYHPSVVARVVDFLQSGELKQSDDT